MKITGLGIDAVLAGLTPTTAADGESPELTDTRDLARLLYAALTGYWPGPLEPGGSVDPADAAEPGDRQDRTGPTGLPAAPEADGVPCTPRQVSAAVPATIDALTCQALFQRPSRHGPALSTPAMLADALANAAPPDPLPEPAPRPRPRSAPRRTAATGRAGPPTRIRRPTRPRGPGPEPPTAGRPPTAPRRGRRSSAP